MDNDNRRFVYVLRSVAEPRRHYVGITADVGGRLAAHNAGLSPHSSKFRPWKVVVVVECPDEQQAVRFEKYLKSASGRAFTTRHFG